MSSIKTTNQNKETIENFSFGLKLNFIDKKVSISNMIKLTNTEEGHNKFYYIELLREGRSSVTNFIVRCHYGKIGNIANYSNHAYRTEIDARKFMTKKLGFQLKKGYKEIN